MFLLGESQGQRSLVGCCLWGHAELDMTEVTWQQQQYSDIYTHTRMFIHSDIEGHLSCLHILANVNHVVNIGVHVYVYIYVLF